MSSSSSSSPSTATAAGTASNAAEIEERLNVYMAGQVGLTPAQVKFLRSEFKKYGRNPLPSSLEIVAIENGFDENKVKALFELYLAYLRKTDGMNSMKAM